MSFKNIAELTESRRGLSQEKMAAAMGYKNGQYISNLERGLCGLPLKKVNEFCKITDTPKELVKAAYLKDCEAKFDEVTSVYST